MNETVYAIIWIALFAFTLHHLWREDFDYYEVGQDDRRARLVGYGEDRLTRPRDDDPNAIAIPIEDGYRFLLLPDGPNYPETIGVAIGSRSS